MWARGRVGVLWWVCGWSVLPGVAVGRVCGAGRVAQGKIKAMETELASMRESVTELEDSIRGLEEQNGLLKRALGDAP